AALSGHCVSSTGFATANRRSPPMTRPSALVRSPHRLHRLLDMAPFAGLVRLSPAFAGQGLLGGLRDRRGTVLLEHLTRNGVNLRSGHHVALLLRWQAGAGRSPPAACPYQTVQDEVSFPVVPDHCGPMPRAPAPPRPPAPSRRISRRS